MTFVYLAVGVLSAAPAVSASAPQPDDMWFVSLQVGAGAQGADTVTLVRPRLGTEGERHRVVLSVPLVLRLEDRPEAGAGAIFDWHDPAFFAGFIERIDFRSPGGTVTAHVGSLVQESLGHGVLLDRYTARHDPRRHRTGGRVDVRLPRLVASALVDSFIRPHVVAGSLRVLPLAALGVDWGERVAVTAEAAADLRAPHHDGKSPLAAFDLDIGVTAFRNAELAVEIYAAGAALSKPAFGAHVGVQVEWRGRGCDSLVLRLETVASGSGYDPGYFDEAYSVERFAVPARGWLPKAEQHPNSTIGARGTLDASFGWVRFGLAAELVEPRGPGSFSVYARLARASWTVAAALGQRHVGDASDLLHIGPASSASLDGSINLLGGLFAFSQVRHSFRRPPHGELEPVVDWLLGVGYGAQAGQTPGS